MPDVAVPTAPPLGNLRRVELVQTGSWNISSGRWQPSREDLIQAVAALENCPAVRRPVLKLGHSQGETPLWQGNPTGAPAVGWVDNLALENQGHTLVGDFVGMPGWLGDIAASAYPDRSVEGKYDFRCQIGHTHPFVLTAVALLGVTPPGVGTLKSLQDVGRLYGVEASDGTVVAFDPSQPRDADGQWTDIPGGGLPDLDPADDKLGLGSRIRLGRGERLVGSSKVRAGDANYDNAAVLAKIATPNGPELRLGIVDSGHSRDDTGRWSAANRGGTVKLDENGIGELRGGLNAAITKGREHQRSFRELYRTDAGDFPYDPDDTFHTGSVASPWGDLVYLVRGIDDEDGGWGVSFAVRPPDAGDNWQPEEHLELDLSPAKVRQLVKELDSVTVAAAVDVVAHMRGRHDQSSHGRRYGPGGNLIRRVTRGGRRNAVRTLNGVLRQIRDDEAAVRPGMTGGPLTDLVQGIRDGVDGGQFSPDQALTLLSSLVFRPDVASNPRLSTALAEATGRLRDGDRRDAPNAPNAPSVPEPAGDITPEQPTTSPTRDGGNVNLVSRLRSAGSRDEARTLLDGLTVNQLKALADEADIAYAQNVRKADLVHTIVQWTVGRQLDSQAISRPPVRAGAMVQVAAAADVRTGAMVALLPSEADAQRLAVDGGEAAGQLHATVLFLGDADSYDPQARQAIVEAVRDLAEVIPPGEVDGMAIAAFNPDKPDKDTCIVLELGGEGLEDVHGLVEQAVSDVAAEHGLMLPEQHSPWRPHLTLRYTDDLKQVPALADRAGPVRIDRLRVAFAGESVDIPLSGEGWTVTAQAADNNELKRFWTKDPRGLAKWATKPHPWTALYRQLRKHVGAERAKRIASQWFKEVFGIWPGERKGRNPAGPG